MNLVGGIKFIENRLGGRKRYQGKEKPAQKNSPIDAVDEKKEQTAENQISTENDTRIGRKIDTTA